MVPVEGGVPQRLTWHPGSDIVQDFTVDGSAVLFTSARAVYSGRHRQLFTVTLDGKFPEQLPIPTAFKATYSPDGSKRSGGIFDLSRREKELRVLYEKRDAAGFWNDQKAAADSAPFGYDPGYVEAP